MTTTTMAHETLALRCLAHLQQEEAMLQATLSLVEETRAGLLKRDWTILREALDKQQHTIAASAELSKQRDQLRAQIAAELELSSEDATIGALAAHTTDSLREQLLLARGRLTKSTSRINVLNRANTVLAMQTNHIVTDMIHHLVGVKPQPRNYARTGLMETTDHSSILDTDL